MELKNQNNNGRAKRSQKNTEGLLVRNQPDMAIGSGKGASVTFDGCEELHSFVFAFFYLFRFLSLAFKRKINLLELFFWKQIVNSID